MGALHSEFSKIDDDAWNFTRIIWLVLTMTSTLYSYSWDIFMDWDLSGNPWKPRDPSQLMVNCLHSITFFFLTLKVCGKYLELLGC